ncbi:hypothetical protein C0Q97_04395 [Streptomyces albidoflavus]|nr:hypothetical protein C0Q97_04395 [Streptomyces albidoflavus]
MVAIVIIDPSPQLSVEITCRFVGEQDVRRVGGGESDRHVGGTSEEMDRHLPEQARVLMARCEHPAPIRALELGF